MKDHFLIVIVYIVIGVRRAMQIPRWIWSMATGKEFKWADFSGPQ